MPNFSKLLQRPAGEAKRPKAIPVSNGADYPGIIKSFSLEEPRSGRQVDYESIVRFQIGLTGWPEDEGIAEEDKMEESPDGGLRQIDLSRRQLRRDFYDNALYRLDDFIRSCGIEPAGRSYEEILPEMVGREVLVEVQQYLNQNTNEIGNQIGRLTGTAPT